MSCILLPDHHFCHPLALICATIYHIFKRQEFGTRRENKWGTGKTGCLYHLPGSHHFPLLPPTFLLVRLCLFKMGSVNMSRSSGGCAVVEGETKGRETLGMHDLGMWQMWQKKCGRAANWRYLKSATTASTVIINAHTAHILQQLFRAHWLCLCDHCQWLWRHFLKTPNSTVLPHLPPQHCTSLEDILRWQWM